MGLADHAIGRSHRRYTLCPTMRGDWRGRCSKFVLGLPNDLRRDYNFHKNLSKPLIMVKKIKNLTSVPALLWLIKNPGIWLINYFSFNQTLRFIRFIAF
jgi:hypothetical protein